jgi:pimeloyl-ACP methyl ester carboxylesterase
MADGTPVNEVQRLIDHWLHKYDWRTHEAQLNALPQFTLPVEIEGFDILTIHFVHKRSASPNAVPLLFIHGWPGHFHEVSKILPLLTDPPAGEQAFHVVAPSIPGFGFSTNPSVKGYNIAKIAETFDKLMHALGYDKYVAQGGDWGSTISRMLGIEFTKTCRAAHVNLLRGVEPPRWYRNPWVWFKMNSQLVPDSKEEEYMMARSRWFNRDETGYRVGLL